MNIQSINEVNNTADVEVKTTPDVVVKTTPDNEENVQSTVEAKNSSNVEEEYSKDILKDWDRLSMQFDNSLDDEWVEPFSFEENRRAFRQDFNWMLRKNY